MHWIIIVSYFNIYIYIYILFTYEMFLSYSEKSRQPDRTNPNDSDSVSEVMVVSGVRAGIYSHFHSSSSPFQSITYIGLILRKPNPIKNL